MEMEMERTQKRREKRSYEPGEEKKSSFSQQKQPQRNIFSSQ
jgi:hypothetical protein